MINSNNPIYDVGHENTRVEDKYNNQYDKILSDSKKNIVLNDYAREDAYFRENHEKSKNVRAPKIKKTHRLSGRGKNFIKRFAKTSGLIGLIAVGTHFTIGKIEEHNYQKEIDNGITTTDYDSFYEKMTDESKEKITKSSYEEDKQKFGEYLAAIDTVKKYEGKKLDYNSLSYEELEDAKSIIEKYTKSGEAIKIAYNLIETQMDNAKKYGDYDCNKNKGTQISYVKSVEDNVKGFTISDISGEVYNLNDLSLFDNKIPGNLKGLAEDIFEYRENGKWKNAEECIEFGIDIGEDIGAVMQEYYIMSENGEMKRIDGNEYNKRKSAYEKEQEDANNKAKYELMSEMSR